MVACSASSKCPKDSPCCSAEGRCGSGAMQCAGGCNPLHSFAATSCLPNPICVSQNITLSPTDFNNEKMFRPILDYTGDPSLAPFTLDSGSLGKGPEGVLLELKISRQSKISTTNYILYGEMEATIRHEARAGLVAAFITMSDIKDEIDWEFTGGDSNVAKTNYFYMGQAVTTHGMDETPSSDFNVSDWHTYGLNWQPDRLQWKMDGRVIRTVTRSQAGDSYPRSASRIQLSTWAGGNSTNPQGTIDWAGGLIDWDTSEYKANGFYAQELKSFVVNCADQSSAGLTTQGSGTPTSWVYTGANSSSTGVPEFQLSTNKIRTLSNPGNDGLSGYPGYDGAQAAGTTGNANSWDGSGKSGSKSGSSDSNNSDGLKFNKDTAIQYGIPTAAGVMALIAIWAIAVLCARKRRRARRSEANGIEASSVAPDGIYAVTSKGGLGRNGSKYIPLSEMNDSLPMGTERVGTGIRPAVGPTPDPGFGHGGYASQEKYYNNAAWQSTESLGKYSYDSGSRQGYYPPQGQQQRPRHPYPQSPYPPQLATPQVDYYSTPQVAYRSQYEGQAPRYGARGY